jgi:hypothetical protein
MRKFGNIFGWICVAIAIGFFAVHISANFVENFRLVTGGTVTHGIVSAPGFCPTKRGYGPGSPLSVQFTDAHGMQQEAAALDCSSIIFPVRQDGEPVSIVYLQDTPTLARIQDDLVMQFWLLEVPSLLILLFILYLLGRFQVKRMRVGEGRMG